MNTLVVQNRFRPFRWLVVAMASLLPGCGQEESIRTYRVAKEDQAPRRVAEPASGSPQVMLGAIVPHGDAAWFFKLQSSPDLARAHRDDFLQVLESLGFDAEGRPRWRLPDGWSERIEQGITYARLTEPAEGVAITVTQLPVRSGGTGAEWERYVLENINRWRGQLGLPPAAWEEVLQDLKELPELASGSRPAYWIELEGQASGGGAPFMGGGGRMTAFGSGQPAGATGDPAAGRSGGPAAASAAPRSTESADRSAGSLQFVASPHWRAQDVAGSGMRLAAFQIEREGKAAEVTLIEAGGDIRANLGIWFGQIGVQPDEGMTERVIDDAESVDVNGVPAKVYLVEGAGEGRGEAILVADIPRGPQSLFVKMKGDADLVRAEREAFERFLASLKW